MRVEIPLDAPRVKALTDLFRHEELRPSAEGALDLDLEPSGARWLSVRRPGARCRL